MNTKNASGAPAQRNADQPPPITNTPAKTGMIESMSGVFKWWYDAKSRIAIPATTIPTPAQRTDVGTGSNGSRRMAISTPAKIGIKKPCEYWALTQTLDINTIVFQ